jgi:hypothetical protein
VAAKSKKRRRRAAGPSGRHLSSAADSEALSSAEEGARGCSLHDGGSGESPDTLVKRPVVESPPRWSFLCPYACQNSRRRAKCFENRNTRFGDLKQHLRRSHMCKCKDCKPSGYPVRLDAPCKVKEHPDHGWMSKEEFEFVDNLKSSVDKTAAAAWFSLFKMLCPDSTPPDSPYFLRSSDSYLLDYDDHICNQGTDAIVRCVEDLGLDHPKLREAVASCVLGFWDQWTRSSGGGHEGTKEQPEMPEKARPESGAVGDDEGWDKKSRSEVVTVLAGHTATAARLGTAGFSHIRDSDDGFDDGFDLITDDFDRTADLVSKQVLPFHHDSQYTTENALDFDVPQYGENEELGAMEMGHEMYSLPSIADDAFGMGMDSVEFVQFGGPSISNDEIRHLHESTLGLDARFSLATARSDSTQRMRVRGMP